MNSPIYRHKRKLKIIEVVERESKKQHKKFGSVDLLKIWREHIENNFDISKSQFYEIINTPKSYYLEAVNKIKREDFIKKNRKIYTEQFFEFYDN